MSKSKKIKKINGRQHAAARDAGHKRRALAAEQARENRLRKERAKR